MIFSKERYYEKIPAVTTAMSGRVRVAVNEKESIEKVVDINLLTRRSQTVLKNVYEYDVAWIEPRDGESPLDCTKRLMKEEIVEYDKSNDVNSFTLQGKIMWVPKETRVGLVNSINIEKAAKKSTTTLWYDGVQYVLPIEQALQMLAALELYALECYNVTHSHLAAIDKLTTIEDVVAYDYKTGYPAKLVF